MRLVYNPDRGELEWIASVDDGTAAGQLAFWDVSNWTPAETTELYWDDTNKRLGVGRSSPDDSLDVRGGLQLVGDDGTWLRIAAKTFSNTDSHSSVFLAHKARGTEDSPTVLRGYNEIFNLKCGGFDGANYIIGAQLAGITDGIVSTGIVPMRWKFKTMDAAGYLNVVMLLRASGEVETTGDIIVAGTVYAEDFLIYGGTIGGLGDSTTELDIRRKISNYDNANVTGSGTINAGGDCTQASDLNYKVEIDLAGDIGTATFKWSDDGGSTWDAEDVEVPEAYADLNNGVRVWFRSGAGQDFNLGDYITFTAIGTDNQVHTLVVDTTNNRVGIGKIPAAEALEVAGNIAITGTVDGIDVATDVAANTTHRGLTNNPHTVTPGQLSLVIGTNVLAQQAIGIADDNLVEVDGPGAGAPANGEYAKWTANGLEGKTYAELLADLSNDQVGATLPGAPYQGQIFLHTPTGRNILYCYDGSDWQTSAIASFGAMTMYVDNANGTDTLSTKGAGGTTDAFDTIQFAIDTIPGIVNGDVVIYVDNDNEDSWPYYGNGRTYAETVIIQGKSFAGAYNLIFYGALTQTADADVANGAITAGNGYAHGYLTDAGQFSGDDWSNHLLSNDDTGQFRVIDGMGYTLTYDTGVGSEPAAGAIIKGDTSSAWAKVISVTTGAGTWGVDASGTMVVLPITGTFVDEETIDVMDNNDSSSVTDNNAFKAELSGTAYGQDNNTLALVATATVDADCTYTVYDWGTTISGRITLQGITTASCSLFGFKFTGSTGVICKQASQIVLRQCKLDGSQVSISRWGSCSLFECYAIKTDTYIIWTATFGETVIYRSKFMSDGANTKVAIYASDCGRTNFVYGSIVHDAWIGLLAAQNSSMNLSTSAANGYSMLRHIVKTGTARALRATTGAQIYNTDPEIQLAYNDGDTQVDGYSSHIVP